MTADFAALRTTMVETQLRTVGVNEPAVLDALRRVPREAFVPADRRGLAYGDGAVPLGGGRVLGEPMTLALLLTHLRIRPGERVLVVGSGAGYAAALVAALGASVTALEESPELAALAAAAGVTTVQGPLTEGWAANAPYDVVLIDGAIETLPGALTGQLADGGRLGAVLVSAAGIGQATVGRVAGGHFGGTAVLEVPVWRLPGFARPKAFVF